MIKLKKLKITMLILLNLTTSIYAEPELTNCDQLLQKCAKTVNQQKEAIDSQTEVIQSQEKLIKQQEADISASEAKAKKNIWAGIGSNILTILLFVLL